MPDKEKVIKGLEEVREYIARKGHDLASRKCRMMDKVTDALALLKEQEADKKDAEYMPMEVVPVTIGNDYRTWLCSACGSKLHYGKELICPKCHKKIDWEGR